MSCLSQYLLSVCFSWVAFFEIVLYEGETGMVPTALELEFFWCFLIWHPHSVNEFVISQFDISAVK
jgi:hypothetical protein